MMKALLELQSLSRVAECMSLSPCRVPLSFRTEVQSLQSFLQVLDITSTACGRIHSRTCHLDWFAFAWPSLEPA